MVLTEAQSLVRDTAREDEQSRLAPYARTWEAAGAFPREIVAELGGLGYLGMAVSRSMTKRPSRFAQARNNLAQSEVRTRNVHLCTLSRQEPSP